MTDATVKVIGITVWMWISSEHHAPNPLHQGSQEEGPNHATTDVVPYTIAKESVKFLTHLDTVDIPLVSLTSFTKQHPQQQIVDSDGSDAQIQRIPRKAFNTASVKERTRRKAVDTDPDCSFSLYK